MFIIKIPQNILSWKTKVEFILFISNIGLLGHQSIGWMAFRILLFYLKKSFLLVVYTLLHHT